MEHLLTSWGYLAIFLLTAISALGIPAGSEIAIGYGGALASGQLLTGPHDHLNLAAVIVVATLGEIAGSISGYLVGFFGGRPLVNRLGKYVLLTKADLDRAEAWFARRGESAVFFGRFVPLLRSFLSLAAGLSEMRFVKFIGFSAVACAMWCAMLASIGYSLGKSWHHVIKVFSYAGYVVAALAVLAILAAAYHRYHQIKKERMLAGE